MKKIYTFITQKRTLAASLCGVAIVSFFLVLGHSFSSNKDARINDLLKRAQTIYQADKAAPKKLPSNKVIALSLALEFHNYEGAEFIIKQLEARL